MNSLPTLSEADATEMRRQTAAIEVAMIKAHEDAILIHQQKNLPLVERREGVIVLVDPFTNEVQSGNGH